MSEQTPYIVLRSTQFKARPWKNGLGITYEIARDLSEPYLWRMSSAELKDSGSFSIFSGYQRHLILFPEASITLQFGDREKSLKVGEHFEFSGDQPVHCQVHIPGMDLNIFALRDLTKTSISTYRLKNQDSLRIPFSRDEHFIICISGRLVLKDTKSDVIICPRDVVKILKPDFISSMQALEDSILISATITYHLSTKK